MKAKMFLASFVALFAIAAILVLPNVSAAFAGIDGVYIDGVFYEDNEVASVDAGQPINLKVVFTAEETRENVWVEADIVGKPGFDDVTEEFAIDNGSTYRKSLQIESPFDLDDRTGESRTLRISVETEEGDTVTFDVLLEVQRESYLLDVLSVAGPNEAVAGETIALDVVLENNGRQEAQNTFVTAEIPALGVSSRVFYGDLSSVDQDGESVPEKFDSAERRVFLKIPSNAATGVYDIEITAFNDDTSTTVIKRVVVVSAMSNVISSESTKRFAVGEQADYSMTIINSGNAIKIYELVVDSQEGLNVDLSETVVVVPAGSSKTVLLTAEAEKSGSFDFTVNVHSDGQVLQSETFNAVVEGTSISGTGNAAIVLTIILAIIFVVLLVVLIVLLTRKPESKEEFGESYY